MKTENNEVGKSDNIQSRVPATSSVPIKRRRQFTPQDVDAVCKNCARGLTESESVRLLGKNPAAWFSFKSKASRSALFAEKLEQFTGQRIDQLLAQIEDAGNGKNRREPDWRASLAALKIMSQRRFGDHVVDLDMNVTFNQVEMQQRTDIILKAMHEVYSQNPDLEAKEVVNDVQLGRRDRRTLQWRPECGHVPSNHNITKVLRERVRVMLDEQSKVIDVQESPVKQITEGEKP